MNLSKNLVRSIKQFEVLEPLVQELSEEASLKIRLKDLPTDSELRKLSGCRELLSVVELAGGNRLICRDSVILVPKTVLNRMMNNMELS